MRCEFHESTRIQLVKVCAVRVRKFSWLILFLFSLCAPAQTIDLSGIWHFQLDPQDSGSVSNGWPKSFDDTIQLPGTTSQARKGDPLSLKPSLPDLPPENFNAKRGLTFGRGANYALENISLMHLQQRFSYIGPAWYRREVEIPKSWTNQDVQLVLERVMWGSRVWINGRFIGTQNSLTAPHRYEIGDALKPGKNQIVIRVDNRRQLAIGDPHAYTEESQTIWNGIIGQIALVARDKIRIDGLQLRPDLTRKGIEVTSQMHNGSGKAIATELSLQAAPENFRGKKLPELQVPVSLAPGDNEQKKFYPMGTNFELWSEFNPKLYRMNAILDRRTASQPAATFGMREFKAVDRHFFINGQPTFLRGTVNCCEFPKTGYPDMTGAQWEKIFLTVKSSGLNHARFHTWCPPEIAFETADRLGVYLEVELPNWSFKIGADTNITEFFRAEGGRMIREYGHHPSWVMFTMGNELNGDYSTLDGFKNDFRKLDPQLLYDSTTYPSSPARGKVPEPTDDYYISQDTKFGRARGQDIFENTRPNTETNFALPISGISVPFISHEVGQYCVYPNLTEIPKYDGVLRNTAFEAIRNDLKKKNRLAEANIYTRDSGQLATLLYKEEIERALRTTNQAGFQLLELNDFPGQGTSTVGLLDAFWDSKNLIALAAFQKFCAPVVPLLTMPEFTWQNDEVFDAGIEIANFGNAPLTNATIVWKISDGKKEISNGSFKMPLIPLGNGIQIGRIQQNFSGVTIATKLKVTVGIAGSSIRNDWPVWVYPKDEIIKTNGVEIFQSADENFYQALREGKKVLLLPPRDEMKSLLAAQFTPVFWNPIMFPNQPGSMGAIIDEKNPAFADFPTDPWTNWQWWELLHGSFALNLDAVPEKIEMPFRFVDKFNRNALPAAIFQTRVGAGKLLVCTLDISSDLDSRIAARQLRRSILNYMAGEKFQPQGMLNPPELARLFGEAPTAARRKDYAKSSQNF